MTFSNLNDYNEFVEQQKAIAIAKIGDAKVDAVRSISQYQADSRYAGGQNRDGSYSYSPMFMDCAEGLIQRASEYAGFQRMADTSNLHD